MKLAASNIGWPKGEDAQAAALLRALGFEGVEVAPAAAFAKPLEASEQDIRMYRQWWEQRQLPIVAMQALLFGKADLLLFASSAVREALLEYLSKMVVLGGKLGAATLVFGAPKNRQRGALSAEDAQPVAVDFFRRIGDVAVRAGTRVCIEPNPISYDCDFVVNTAEALALVQQVNHPGFGLHLDAGAMTLNGEDPAQLGTAFQIARHLHASEPALAPVGQGRTPHAHVATQARASGYAGWVSLEMRCPPTDVWETLAQALTVVKSNYGH